MADKELLDAMKLLAEDDIRKLANEMNIPVKMNGGVFDKDATISRLLNGGCENCGKKKAIK